jgi:hypothetical protein
LVPLQPKAHENVVQLRELRVRGFVVRSIMFDLTTLGVGPGLRLLAQRGAHFFQRLDHRRQLAPGAARNAAVQLMEENGRGAEATRASGATYRACLPR